MSDTHLDPPEHEPCADEIAFENWWENEGSGMRPAKSEDLAEFMYRLTQIAWANGSDLPRREINAQRSDALFKLMTSDTPTENPERTPTNE